MKRYFLGFILSIFALTGFSQGGVIVIEGNYQGKNLYVQNPFASGGVGFCVTEVYVNGNLTTDETQSSAFEIDFKPHKLTIGDKVEIKITDNGTGIPKNVIDKIFQPFFTTKPTGQGTGLGLSLAYDIITKQHNGSIKAESKEGEGTSFIIELNS